MPDPLDVAVAAAREAGAIQRRAFRTDVAVEPKGDDDVVTETDRRAERAILDRIADAFPDHAVRAEESGARGASSRSHRWLVDPLDGTTNFVHGIPHFGVSIALEVEGEVELGVVYATPDDDLYTAGRGDGARLNGEPIAVSDARDLERAVIALEFSRGDETRPAVAERLSRLRRVARRTRHMGSSACELAMVAGGSFDGLFGTDLRPWDAAAGCLLVEEAGGAVTRLRGTGHAGRVAASNGLVHDDLLACVGY